jgi:hypothetical protein
VYHVLNRANGRKRIFKDAGDYKAFEQVMAQACERELKRFLAPFPACNAEGRTLNSHLQQRQG